MPVDAILLADQLGVTVAVDRSQAGRGRHKRMAGKSAIFLSPDDRPERLQWAAAHELGEMFACEVFLRANVEFGRVEKDHIDPTLREQVANLFASRLLLPTRSFSDDARRTECDLLELKAIYRTSSHELIVMRLLDLPEPSIVTIFDQGQLAGPTRLHTLPNYSQPNATASPAFTTKTAPTNARLTTSPFKAGPFTNKAGNGKSCEPCRTCAIGDQQRFADLPSLRRPLVPATINTR